MITSFFKPESVDRTRRATNMIDGVPDEIIKYVFKLYVHTVQSAHFEDERGALLKICGKIRVFIERLTTPRLVSKHWARLHALGLKQVMLCHQGVSKLAPFCKSYGLAFAHHRRLEGTGPYFPSTPIYRRLDKPIQDVSVDFSGISACCGDPLKLGEFSPTRLVRMTFTHASSLKIIGANVFRRVEMVSLDLTECTCLETIGSQAFASDAIKTIDLSNCTMLHTIDDNAFQYARLWELDLSRCGALATIGKDAFHCSQLKTLDLSACVVLQNIDERETRTPPSPRPRLPTHRRHPTPYHLRPCLAGAFRFSPLISLTLSGCTALKSIGKEAFVLAGLEQLDLSHCSALAYIGESAFSNSRLFHLNLTGCIALKEIGKFAFGRAALGTLDLSQCPNIEVVASRAFVASPLVTISFLGCSKLISIGPKAFYASQLSTIDLSDCKSLEEICCHAFFCSPLINASFQGCTSLKHIFTHSFYSADLKKLDLSSCKNLEWVGLYAFAGSLRNGNRLVLPDQFSAVDAKQFRSCGIGLATNLNSRIL